MKVTIFGTGYVGLVTGTCLAKMGNHVLRVDVDAGKVARLERGEVPIYEPGLAPLVKRNHEMGRLAFTTYAKPAVAHGEVVFIAVGTPPDEDGSADLRYVLAVARTIGENINGYTVVVNKSTVPVGTAQRVHQTLGAVLTERDCQFDFDVVSNPEFLKEGDAINDCMRPDRIIVGASSTRAVELMHKLYAPFNRNHERLVVKDERSAELTKYTANAMLATKISFVNELANIAERVGADIELVRQGIGIDPRIGYSATTSSIRYRGHIRYRGQVLSDIGVRSCFTTSAADDPADRRITITRDALKQDLTGHFQDLTLVDQASLVPPLPQRARPPMAQIELRDVPAPEFLHHARNGTANRRVRREPDPPSIQQPI